VKALPGNPYDGHKLGVVPPEMEAQIGADLSPIVGDRGDRGHNAPPEHRFRIRISGQKRRVSEAINRDLRRRPAVEPRIGRRRRRRANNRRRRRRRRPNPRDVL
jgi:IS5 family transposase